MKLSTQQWVTGGMMLASMVGQAFGEVDPRVEASIQAVYPALVRIHVVSEEGGDGRMQKQRSSGSGTIISPDGYILTNHHVAGHATRMTVRLSDRQEVRATLVGTDPLSDLAVLKIDKKDLRDPSQVLGVAKFGDSTQLRVGDVVLAMGSPAGISQSVTQGVVANAEMISPGGGSLKMDGEMVGEIVRWIGHDAIIFPGNSGGPLVNLKGEIIGVNEIGIGSLGGAIPGNLAKKVAEELIAKGMVERSWIGMQVQPLLKTSVEKEGVLVSGVAEDSPAAKAGIASGDVIVKINGKEAPTTRALEDLPVFNRLILESPVGGELVLEGTRAGQAKTWKVQTIAREPAMPREREMLSWGMTVRNLSKLEAKEIKEGPNEGVVVQSVSSGSAVVTAKPMIRPDDMIVEVDGKKTPTVERLMEVTQELIKGKTEPVPVLVSYVHDDRNLVTVVKIGPSKETDTPDVAKKAWLGIDTQVITKELAEAMKLENFKGVRVTCVHPGTTAEKAGLKVGDLLTRLDDSEIAVTRAEDGDVFASMIRQYKIGTEVPVTVLREGKKETVKVTFEGSRRGASELASLEIKALEFHVRELSQEVRLQMRLAEEVKGVQITEVVANGWASLAGLYAGDIVVTMNGKACESVEAVKGIVAELEKSKPSQIPMFIRRGNSSLYVELEPTW